MHAIIAILIWSVCSENGLPVNQNVVDLLLETCAVESDFSKYDKQIGGPAMGWWQMEPDTLNDIRINYIKYRPELHRFLEGNLLDAEFAVIMARIHYMRVKAPVPDTRLERAKYWKKYYNTVQGKGTIAKYMEKANRYLGEG